MKENMKNKKGNKRKSKNKGNKKKHISLEERRKIEAWLEVNITQKEIAKKLKRSNSTISKEINNNSIVNQKTKKREYVAKKANLKSYNKQHRKKIECFTLSKLKHSKLRKFVELRIVEGWSPEQISSYTENERNSFEYISAKAIRKWISKRRPNLERYLFWNRNNMKSGPKRKKTKFLEDKERKSMEDREIIFPEFKSEFGHWEMDFVVSRHNSYVLLVITESLTKLTKIKLLENRKNDYVNEAIFSLLKDEVVNSITTDNDIAFQHWKDIEKQLNTNIFFTDPYASWQKGLVENINRWIREFIPKKTNLKLVSNTLLTDIENYLNNKARMILNGDSSYESFCFHKDGVNISLILFDLPKKVS